jgi:glutamate synthase (NADPH/NADH) large chain
MLIRPDKQGLYDNANEHDACGIGFVANINGKQSQEIIQRGLNVLERMAHRGAEGSDNKTGDGAGILLQIPKLFNHLIPSLPKPGLYGTGLIFLPTEAEQIEYCKNTIHQVISKEGFEIVQW